MTEIVVDLAKVDSNTIKAIFEWVSASIFKGIQKRKGYFLLRTHQ